MKFSRIYSLLKSSISVFSNSKEKVTAGSRFKRNMVLSTLASFAAFTVLLNPSAAQALKDYLPPALEQPLAQLQNQKWLQQLGKS